MNTSYLQHYYKNSKQLFTLSVYGSWGVFEGRLELMFISRPELLYNLRMSRAPASAAERNKSEIKILIIMINYKKLNFYKKKVGLVIKCESMMIFWLRFFLDEQDLNMCFTETGTENEKCKLLSNKLIPALVDL